MLYFKVHTFYEAVGFMISAQSDPVVQEHLIKKYMLLPNQVRSYLAFNFLVLSDRLNSQD